MKTTRRSFITRSVLAAAGLTGGLNAAAESFLNEAGIRTIPGPPASKDPDAFKISVFSKHLQWLDYTDMAKAVADIGFDGVDLTVRPQGHVLPENVERELPKAAEAVNKAGKKIYMLTTAIEDADDPVTEKILRTASSLGIRHYRTGWGHYDDRKSVEENIRYYQDKLAGLARLNEKYSISGEYQNHSGVASDGIYFGGAIWDIAGILKAINSKWIGSQYDIYHATVEGANTWPIGLKLISPYIRSIVVKDFIWIKSEERYRNESVPLGEGTVDFKKYFGILKQLGIAVPVSIHYEYPLGGAENGDYEITMKPRDVISAMSRDLEVLKSYLRDAGLLSRS
jgi:L-ribulose-5-phosphate 3-epimerase